MNLPNTSNRFECRDLAVNAQTGEKAFLTVGKPTWHNLGIQVEQAPTSEEAIKLAGLDYEVKKTPLFTKVSGMTISEEGIPTLAEIEKEIPQAFATVRTDTKDVLGLVGKDYNIIQNREVFNFFDCLTQDKNSGITYETAGALGNGERVFLTARLPEPMKIGGRDIIENYIFMYTSHDGSGSVTASFTPIRIVCNNTLNAALRMAKQSSNVVRIRHTQNAKKRMDEAMIIMKMCQTTSEKMELVFNNWTKIRISDEHLKKYLQIALCPSPDVLNALRKNDEVSTNFNNIIDKALNYVHSSEAQLIETAKGTLFGAYNAVTGYYQNVFNFSDDEQKVKSILFGGTAQQRGQKAFDLAFEYSQKGAECLVF